MSLLLQSALALRFIPFGLLSMGCISMQPYGATTTTPPGPPRPVVLAAQAQELTSKELAADAEPWASGPIGNWPQIVLTNYATFAGHTSLKGASSFLVRTQDGRIYGVTARHLIKSAGGVEPPMEPAELHAALREWWIFPRTKSEVAIQLV